MNPKEKIEVMQAFEDGREVESKPALFSLESCSWEVVKSPRWCWASLDYRIKREPAPKEPTLLERIEDNWGDKEVCLLDWNSENILCLTSTGNYHTSLQSMKGLAGYVYNQDKLQVFREPVDTYGGDILMPCAVLFNK